jgi:hypothetical protein
MRCRDGPVQSVPVDVETPDDLPGKSENQLIARVKHYTRLRAANGTSIGIQDFRQCCEDRTSRLLHSSGEIDGTHFGANHYGAGQIGERAGDRVPGCLRKGWLRDEKWRKQ